MSPTRPSGPATRSSGMKNSMTTVRMINVPIAVNVIGQPPSTPPCDGPASYVAHLLYATTSPDKPWGRGV